MDQLKKIIKVNSLTQEEIFVKQAMKNSELHETATALIKAAMIKICDKNDSLHARDVNTDKFLKTMNDSLIQISPQLAYDSGLAKDPDAPDGKKEQTAEDIAKAEAERDKVMQAELMNNVTEAVMKNME